MPDGTKQIKTKRVNPLIPIPPESTKIHGITDADIEHEPSFRQIAHEIANFLESADLAGYNSNKFDVPMLVDEFMREERNGEMKGRRRGEG